MEIKIVVVVLTLFFSVPGLAQVDISNGGVSGQWYNPARDGEGLFVEVIDTNDGQQMSVAWFTYDQEGFQMWLVGNVAIQGNPTSVTVPVIVTRGPLFGPAYDPDRVEREMWGTLTLAFPDCSSGVLGYQSSVGFGSGAINLTRLTSLEQVRCTEPPNETGITPGRWEGEGVCFNVSTDGRTITSIGSTCNNGRAFDSDVESTINNGQRCDAEVQCQGTFAIVDGTFSCTSSGEIGSGTFLSATEAAGSAQESEGTETCIGEWRASPVNP